MPVVVYFAHKCLTMYKDETVCCATLILSMTVSTRVSLAQQFHASFFCAEHYIFPF